ncbi:hypothetical protein TELCIR_05892 [Teladorsagia circumcincta]|uniref:C-type lectin domain-containing protein n=1 Tax=Teladorsagia circumcincta TaxID=45464 RepID=A0A2G9URR1_TELCI|nr:hypothetical protein TELCIR_05892 [Teladorsagia circumcincta]
MTGVLCDKKIPERLKSKIYRTVVRPVAIYGAECWPVTKEGEARLSVMETKMLRWTAGVTRLDHIRNDTIRRRFGVAPIADKMLKLALGDLAFFSGRYDTENKGRTWIGLRWWDGAWKWHDDYDENSGKCTFRNYATGYGEPSGWFNEIVTDIYTYLHQYYDQWGDRSDRWARFVCQIQNCTAELMGLD